VPPLEQGHERVGMSLHGRLIMIKNLYLVN